MQRGSCYDGAGSAPWRIAAGTSWCAWSRSTGSPGQRGCCGRWRTNSRFSATEARWW